MQAKGFFGSLFDYSFSSFVTPRIIKVLYVLATILIGLWTLFLAAAAFETSETAGVLTLFLFGPLFFLVSMLYARVLLELVIVFFRINGNVQEIRDDRLGVAPQAAPTPALATMDAPAAVLTEPPVQPEQDTVETETPAASGPDVTSAECVTGPPPATEPDPEPPTTTRYCENCGAERRPGGKFCTSCGHA